MTRGEEILSGLGIEIWVDGPSMAEWLAMVDSPYVKGATTNPSLMRKLGVTDYEKFAKSFLEVSRGLPVSFEVIADTWPEMKRQALKLASWGGNVLVKIPVTNTKGESAWPLIGELGREGVRVNVTAITTKAHVLGAEKANPAIVSIFVGRITDGGAAKPDWSGNDIVDADILMPIPSSIKALWASTREPYNIIEASHGGFDIITVPVPILAKAVQKFGCDLAAESLSLVKTFHSDALAAGFTL